MPLTPEEQEELRRLESELSPAPAAPKKAFKDMTPEELTAKYGASQEDIAAAMAGGLPGAGIGGEAVSKIAQKTGLSKIPDFLMQKAAGMKKYIPGVGDKLMEQGVFGTTSGMKQQVGKKIGQEAERLSGAVGQIKSQIPSEPIATEIAEKYGKKFTTSTGITPELAKPMAETVERSVQDIAKRGPVSPQEALELKRIAQETGWSSKGEALDKLKSKIAQSETRGYGSALEEAYGKQFKGQPNVVEDANAKLAALLQGKKGLSTPISIGSVNPIQIARGATKGIVGSTAAHGTRLAGKATKGLADLLGRRGIESLVTGDRSTQTKSGLTPEEEEELKRLESELGQ